MINLDYIGKQFAFTRKFDKIVIILLLLPIEDKNNNRGLFVTN